MSMNIDNIKSKKTYNWANDVAWSSSSGQNNSEYKSFDEEFELYQKELAIQNKEELEALNEKGLLNIDKIKELNIVAEAKKAIQDEIKIEQYKKLHNINLNLLGHKTFKINFKDLKESDFDFLHKLTQKHDFSINISNTENQQNLTVLSNNTLKSSGSVDFSKMFAELINQACTSRRPVRIDFDKEISVIIKIDRDGKVSAEFLPGDKAAEIAIKNALPELQAKFNDEKLPYKELKSRHFDEKNERRNNKKEAEEDE